MMPVGVSSERPAFAASLPLASRQPARDTVQFGLGPFGRQQQPPAAGPNPSDAPPQPAPPKPPRKKMPIWKQALIAGGILLGVNTIGGMFQPAPAGIPLQSGTCVVSTQSPTGTEGKPVTPASDDKDPAPATGASTAPTPGASETAATNELTKKASPEHANYENQGALICVDEALALVQGGHVEAVQEIQDPTKTVAPHYEFKLKNGIIVILDKPETDAEDQRLKSALRDADMPVSVVTKAEGSFLGGLMSMLLPILLMVGLFVFLQRKMGGAMGNQLKGKTAENALVERPTQRLDDVKGYPQAVSELRDIVDTFNNYTAALAKYQQDPINNKLPKPPKGVLLTGPPGTGKTMMARAVAGEANVPFYALSGSEFVEMYVGLGASRVRDVFNAARAGAPAIVFIDEIDAIGKKRGGKGNISGGNDERVQTLNEMLKQIDGFRENKLPILLIAATNFADELDEALTRSGRLEKEIGVNFPHDWKAQKEILEVQLKKMTLDEDVDLESVAKMAASGGPKGAQAFVGADHKQLAEEAERLAEKDNNGVIKQGHLVAAWERIMMGLAVSELGTQDEKELVASHEHGHGLATLADPKGKDKVFVVSMVPRSTGVLGYVFPDRSGRSSMLPNRSDMLHDILISIAGRAAEVVRYGDENITPGASSDLQSIEQTFRQMMTTGMLTDRVTNYRAVADLTKEDTELLNTVRNNALQAATDMLRLIPADKYQQLVDESLEAGTLVGQDAMAFYERILGSDFDWAPLRAIVADFIKNPIAGQKPVAPPNSGTDDTQAA